MNGHGRQPASNSGFGLHRILQYRLVVLLLVIAVMTASFAGFSYHALHYKQAHDAVAVETAPITSNELARIQHQAITVGAIAFVMAVLLSVTVFCLLRLQLFRSVRLIQAVTGGRPQVTVPRGMSCLNVFRRVEDDIKYLLRISDNERRLRSVLDSVSDAVITIDEAGIVKSFNSAAEKTFGYAADEVVGQNVSVLMPSPDRDNHDRYIRSYLETGQARIIGKGREVVALRKDGGRFDLHLQVTEWRNDDGERLFTGIMWDVSEQKAAHAELEFRATYDQLTGIYNRSSGEDRLHVEMIRADRYGCPLAVVMLDVDHFKEFNDSLGHQAGDRILRRLASIVISNIRETDVFIRWGGEEFLIILPETTLAGAELMAQKLCDLVQATDFVSAERVTISMGVAHLSPLDDKDALLRKADQALYEAKRNGRNRVVIAVDDLSYKGTVASQVIKAADVDP